MPQPRPGRARPGQAKAGECMKGGERSVSAGRPVVGGSMTFLPGKIIPVVPPVARYSGGKVPNGVIRESGIMWSVIIEYPSIFQ